MFLNSKNVYISCTGSNPVRFATLARPPSFSSSRGDRSTDGFPQSTPNNVFSSNPLPTMFRGKGMEGHEQLQETFLVDRLRLLGATLIYESTTRNPPDRVISLRRCDVDVARTQQQHTQRSAPPYVQLKKNPSFVPISSLPAPPVQNSRQQGQLLLKIHAYERTPRAPRKASLSYLCLLPPHPPIQKLRRQGCDFSVPCGCGVWRG